MSHVRRSPYIASPLYDWVFFLLPPIVSLLLGAVVSGTSIAEDRFWLVGRRVTWSTLGIGILIHAHLVAVFVRSHLNQQVFALHRFRFVVLPILAFSAMMVSMWAVVIATVLVTFWDVYHSALQTFGLGRIYDRNCGNDPNVGRRLDFFLNLLLYAGPILSGATMLAHFQKFELFADVGALFLADIPAYMVAGQRTLAWALMGFGVAFVLFYVLAYARLARLGYVVGFQKVFLTATTGLTSIWAWVFNPWGQAFLIMNLFHAVQYLGLVYWSEKEVLVSRLRLGRKRFAGFWAATAFLVVVFLYGGIAEIHADQSRPLWSLVQVVSLMHFFYDGFVWSVRKRQI